MNTRESQVTLRGLSSLPLRPGWLRRDITQLTDSGLDSLFQVVDQDAVTVDVSQDRRRRIGLRFRDDREERPSGE
jgi:hypothetical protein